MSALIRLQLVFIISIFLKCSVMGYVSNIIIKNKNNNNIRSYNKFQAFFNSKTNKDKSEFQDNNSSKESIMDIMPIINIGGDFEKLVKKSSIFVDKSLFIKEIIESADEVTLITMPRLWGKTFNFDMLERFLSIQVIKKTGAIIPNTQTDNYKLFAGGEIDLDLKSGRKKTLKPLKIAKEEVIMLNYQGQLPVISVSFQDCKGNNIDEIESNLKVTMTNLLKRFSYLKKSKKRCSSDMKVKEKYIELLENVDKDFKTTIKDLSYLLNAHFGKEVWILIDDYDTPATKAYRKFDDNKTQNVVTLFRDILECAFKNNEYLAKGVITGEQYMIKSDLLSGLDNLGKYSPKKYKYSQYYGVNEEEMEMLQTHFGVNNVQKNILKNYYLGFREKVDSIEEYTMKYNIFSVVNYLNNMDDGRIPYWVDTGNIDFVEKLFEEEKVRREICSSIMGNVINNFNLILDFSIEDFRLLTDIINRGRISPINRKKDLDIFFSYLYITGYLTYAGEDQFGFPNGEIKHSMRSYVLKSYEVTGFVLD